MAASVIFPFLFFALFVTLIIFVLLLFMKRKDGTRFQFSTKNLFLFFMYFMISLSIILSSLGGIALLKYGFASAFGTNFVFRDWYGPEVPCSEEIQYRTPYDIDGIEIVSETERIEKCEQQREKQQEEGQKRIARQYKETLLEGITFLLLGSVLLVIHLAVVKQFAKDPNEDGLLLQHMFLILNNLLYGVAGLVSISAGVYQLLKYLILEQDGKLAYSSFQPGEMLAYALIFVPLWIFFTRVFMKKVKSDG